MAAVSTVARLISEPVALRGVKDMNDSSIPNPCKACSAALGFFLPGGSWQAIGKHFEAVTVGGSQDGL